MTRILFNTPFTVGDEIERIREAIDSGHLAGNGKFTRICQDWLKRETGCASALLTHSCTAALEMAALLAEVGPGDEVILPSYTFVSTANAFVLRGATPVFVDIREDTLNIDENLIEAAITERTRAICVVHYAGVACEMDPIMAIAKRHGLPVIEDAAQGIGSAYKGRPLGTFGTTAAFSFHETKNVVSGEGGALAVNDRSLAERAEILWEKGTNRSKFFRGQVDKYTWVDIGSSFLPSELVAAFLSVQLEHMAEINLRRMELWQRYRDGLQPLFDSGRLRAPVIPAHCTHNAHMFYILARTSEEQAGLLDHLKANGISAVFHYIPLHSSPAGRRFGRAGSTMEKTDDLSARLVRLPLHVSLEKEAVDQVISSVAEFLS
ncbi:MAG TPA: dTDP-4-amino-4,6-dideoxygalactose transaminase [Gammaproteobacteria bacterium]